MTYRAAWAMTYCAAWAVEQQFSPATCLCFQHLSSWHQPQRSHRKTTRTRTLNSNNINKNMVVTTRQKQPQPRHTTAIDFLPTSPSVSCLVLIDANTVPVLVLYRRPKSNRIQKLLPQRPTYHNAKQFNANMIEPH